LRAKFIAQRCEDFRQRTRKGSIEMQSQMRELDALELDHVAGGMACGPSGYHVNGMVLPSGTEVSGLLGPRGMGTGCYYPNLGGTGTNIFLSDYPAPTGGGGYVDGP
jgi:hypothetical protein